jgi:hypothetical protein
LSAIDKIIKELQGGYWCRIRDVAQYCGFSEFKTMVIIDFLHEFGFVNLSKDKDRVKLSSSMLKFVNETEGIRI